jgi:hypothetical protein
LLLRQHAKTFAVNAKIFMLMAKMEKADRQRANLRNFCEIAYAFGENEKRQFRFNPTF